MRPRRALCLLLSLALLAIAPHCTAAQQTAQPNAAATNAPPAAAAQTAQTVVQAQTQPQQPPQSTPTNADAAVKSAAAVPSQQTQTNDAAAASNAAASDAAAPNPVATAAATPVPTPDGAQIPAAPTSMPVLTTAQPPASTMPAVAPVVTPSSEMPPLDRGRNVRAPADSAPAAAAPVIPPSATPGSDAVPVAAVPPLATEQQPPAAVSSTPTPPAEPSHPANLGPGSDMAAVLAAQLSQQGRAQGEDAAKAQKDAAAAASAERLAARRAAMEAQTRERQQREAERAAVLAGQAARAAQAAAAAQAAQAAVAESSPNPARPSTRVGTLGPNGPLGRVEGRAGGGGGGGVGVGVGYAHEGHVHASDPDTTLIQHGGHSHTVRDAESHSGLIFGSMLGTMVLAQLGLFLWKKYHLSSFDRATLAGLWLFPMGYSVWHGVLEHWRMLSLWVAFSAACMVTMRKALRKPIARSTPREVYQFFTIAYRVSYATAFAGYLVIMAHFLGLSRFPLLPSPQSALTLLFYGLYFGVLGRDLANVCSTSMAVSMGYSARRGEIPRKAVPANVCAICDGELVKSSVRLVGHGASSAADSAVEEKVHTLNCGHQFHDFCLRGWTMIGKRDSCASCSEKVVLSQTLKGPWETPSIAWAVLLDAIRYLIVFNPVVLLLAQLVLYLVY